MSFFFRNRNQVSQERALRKSDVNDAPAYPYYSDILGRVVHPSLQRAKEAAVEFTDGIGTHYGGRIIKVDPVAESPVRTNRELRTFQI